MKDKKKKEEEEEIRIRGLSLRKQVLAADRNRQLSCDLLR